MPTMANFLLKRDDGTDVTYIPVSDTPFPNWRTNTSGVGESGQNRIFLQYEKITKGANAGKTRVNIRLVQPIMEVIPSGSVAASGFQAGPTVADEESVSLTFFLSPRGTNETAADLLRQFAHLIIGGSSSTGSAIGPNYTTADTYRDASTVYTLPYGIVNRLFPS